MTRSPRTIGKLLALFASLALAEAIVVVWLGARILRQQGILRLGRTDDALRREAELLTEGPYRLSDDPLVGFELKRSFAYRYHEVIGNSDADGCRLRTGPAPAPDSLRIVLVGDSVAFGYGVADGETYGARLEALLRAALGAKGPHPVVFTVACPGWNHKNSLRKLRSELGRLDPDVVLYLAVDNDLDDATTVTETGQRQVWVDPSRGLERPMSSVESFHLLVAGVQGLPSLEWARDLRRAGSRAVERVLCSGITPESRARWDALVDDIRETRARVALGGAAFAVVLARDNDFERQLEMRLAEAMPSLEVLGLFSGPVPEDTLGSDPHPNPRCVQAGALRMAGFLIERGWVPGARADRLPVQDAAYAQRAWERPSPADRTLWWQGTRQLLERFLEPVVDIPRVVGIHQVYGGMYGDGTVGRSLFVALHNTSGARELRVDLTRKASAALYPLRLTVSIGERAAGSVELPAPEADGDASFTFSLPLSAEEAMEPYLDVLVQASHSEGEDGPRGWRLASFRLRRIALE